MRRGLPLLLAALCIASAAGQEKNWFTQAFFHEGDGSAIDPTEWVVQITSIVQRPMTCTVSWTGVRVRSPDFDRPLGAANGTLTLAVPAYSGSGPAVVATQGVLDVGIVKQHTTCR